MEKYKTPQYYNLIPDVTLGGSLVLAYFCDRFLPLAEVVPYPVTLTGWIFIFIGMFLALRAISLLKLHKTATEALATPTTLITTGLFKGTRNPLYVAYVIITLGAAVLSGSFTAFAAPLLCFTIFNKIVIPEEERILGRVFGIKYGQYKHSVRRWL